MSFETDMQIDDAIIQYGEILEQASFFMKKTDTQLKTLTAGNEKPIIVSIRGFAKLSFKQRWVLASEIARENDFSPQEQIEYEAFIESNHGDWGDRD